MAIDFKDFAKLPWYYRVLIVAGVSGGLLGLFWYQYLSPIQEQIDARTAKLTTLEEQVAKSLQQKLILEQFKRETEELQARLDDMKSVLPSERETDQLLRQVQDSASNSGLRLLRLGPRPPLDREVYYEWPIDMEVVGTYHNMGAFLDRIRRLPRIVNVSNLKIQSRASEGDAVFNSSVAATYTATTFIYREEEAADAPVPR